MDRSRVIAAIDQELLDAAKIVTEIFKSAQADSFSLRRLADAVKRKEKYLETEKDETRDANHLCTCGSLVGGFCAANRHYGKE